MISRLLAGAALTLMTSILAGCGGGGGGPASTAVTVAATGATITGITVISAPVVTFTVKDSTGNPVTGLTLYQAPYDGQCGSPDDDYTSNAAFAIAKFDGTNWQSLVSLRRSSSNPYNAIEGTTDPIHGASSTVGVGSLSYDASSQTYTYTFGTDVTNASYSNVTANSLGTILTNGSVAIKDNKTLHRVVLQLCYYDSASKKAVKLNPTLDFTLGGNGIGVPYRDGQGNPILARKVAARESCNDCHVNFAQHGGDRVDPNYCVVCHNPGSTDYATGNAIDFKLMVHKFHMGKRLTQDYAVGSAVAREDLGGGNIAGVLYPQDQRNCVKCHDGSATAVHKTAQGDNWKTMSGKNACWACHDKYDGIKFPGNDWQLAHTPYATLFTPSLANPDGTPDSVCQTCHNDAGGGVAPTNAKAHEIPEWVLSRNYRLNIWNVSKNPDNSLTVEYSVSNPNTGSDYDLLAPALASRFTSLSLLIGWNTTDYANDGGPGHGQPFSVKAATDASMQRVGSSNRFTLKSPVLPAQADGTLAVAFQGAVNESGLRVPVANAVQYFALSGSLVGRRQVVSAEKCNTCHGPNLGYAGISTFLPGLGAHDADSNNPEACVICHNGNNPLRGTVVSGGVVTHYAESADFKRMIHMMHAGQAGNYPVRPNTKVATAFTANPPGIYSGLKDCSVCHVGNSHILGKSILGTSVTFDVDTSVDSPDATVTDTDALDNLVITPKASSCSSCHTSAEAKAHMIDNGARFGTVTQANVLSGTFVLETCDGCHQSGAMQPVDTAHLGN